MLYKHCLCSVLWCFLLSRGIHPSGSFSSNKSRVMFFVTCIFVESLGFNSQDALSYRVVILGGNFPAGAEVYASTWEAFPSIAVIQHICDQCSHKRPCWCPVSVLSYWCPRSVIRVVTGCYGKRHFLLWLQWLQIPNWEQEILKASLSTSPPVTPPLKKKKEK